MLTGAGPDYQYAHAGQGTGDPRAGHFAVTLGSCDRELFTRTSGVLTGSDAARTLALSRVAR
ncbi:hypothetical protein GCM10023192_41110 [Amycolatopsis samaneae]